MFTETCKLNIEVVNMSWFIVIFIFFSSFFEPSWLHVELFNTKLDILLYLQQTEAFLT